MLLHKRFCFILILIIGYYVGVSFAEEQRILPDNYLKIEMLVRITSQDAIYDYEISPNKNDITLLKKFPGRLANNSAPILINAFNYKGSTCSDFMEKNREKAKRLKSSFDMKYSGCRITFSDDGKLIAFVNSRFPQNKKTVELIIINNENLETILKKKIGEKRGLSDLVWKPDSQVLLILEEKSHFGLNPLELLSAFAGHPVPHNDIYFAYLDVKSGAFIENEKPFMKNIRYGEGFFYVRNNQSQVDRRR